MLHFHNRPILSNQTCTLMLLSNMREPEWIPISCYENLVNTVICKRIKQYKTRSNYLNSENKSVTFYRCKTTTLLIDDKCYGFLWRAKGLISDHFCLEFKARGVSPDKLDYFYHIFNAVSATNKFPILIF